MAGILSDLASLSNPFGVPSEGQWNLARGVWTPLDGSGREIVLFFESAKEEPVQNRTAIDQITDGGGRRLAMYEYPYQDGQRVQDLGRKGETYTFNLKFFGDNYQQRFIDFQRLVVQQNVRGSLVHPILSPIRGALTVRLRDYEFLHRYEEWNAVTIRAIFVEDNTGEFDLVSSTQESQSTDSTLRSALQTLVATQKTISGLISDVSALLLLPGQIQTALKARLTSITGQVSRLLGQLGATFSHNAQQQSIAAQSSGLSGGVASLSSGTVASASSSGQTQLAQLPAVYQVGFDATTQAAVQSLISAFVSANQVTPQQAVFSANQSRQAITAAINEIIQYAGNDSYEIVLQYRALAISIQQSVEASLASFQTRVKVYTLPTTMSLRLVAKANGLDYNRQNEIEALNPYLPSVNLIPAGSQVLVPVA